MNNYNQQRVKNKVCSILTMDVPAGHTPLDEICSVDALRGSEGERT